MEKEIGMPSLRAVLGSNKLENEAVNSYNTNFSTQQNSGKASVSEGANFDDLKFGGLIQKTQVFRLNREEFTGADLRKDSVGDLHEYKEQVLLKKRLQLRDVKISDMERIIVQEKGEKWFADKTASKSRQWLERVEDEFRRDQIKQ